MIVKRENPYLKEFANYYKSIGINKIFIYDNNDLNGEHIEDILQDEINDGFVKVYDYTRGLPIHLPNNKYTQLECYKTFYYGEDAKDFDWICYFDCDEFLTFDRTKYSSISDIINTHTSDDVGVLSIPWTVYTSNGKFYYEDKPVMERFTTIDKHAARWNKCIVRTHCKIENPDDGHMHHCFKLIGLKTVDTEGNRSWYILNPNLKPDICLNHYRCKSLEEHIRRRLGNGWGTVEYTKHVQNMRNLLKTFDDHRMLEDDRAIDVISKIF